MNAILTLKKMKPLRQVEAAELMIAMENYTIVYAKALLASTRPEHLVDADGTRHPKGASPEQIARMEREMSSLQDGIKRIEASYGADHLHLVLAVGYVRSLLGNASIARHLEKHHPEICTEFASICEATSMGPQATD